MEKNIQLFIQGFFKSHCYLPTYIRFSLIFVIDSGIFPKKITNLYRTYPLRKKFFRNKAVIRQFYPAKVCVVKYFPRAS